MTRFLQDMVFISTRPEGQSDELAQLFSEAGATVLEMPLIKIQPISLTEKEKNCFNQLTDFNWLVFTSSNGVRCFFDNLQEIQGDHVLPKSLQIAVIGNKTEKVLSTFGYHATFVNPGSTGEDFADAFVSVLKNKSFKPNVLLALGNIARTVIQDQISEIASCTRINFYDTVYPSTLDEKIMQSILDDRYELLLFTSPSGVHNFLKLAGEIQHKKIRIACIGETTSKAAIENNISPLVVAKNSTVVGLFESVLNYYKNINQ